MEPLQLRDRLGIDARKRVAPLHDQDIAAPRGLLGSERGEQLGPRGLGPIGPRLDQSAGGDRPDADVGPHHEQLIIALRRREFDIGILAGLDATRERDRCQQRDTPTGA